MFCSNCGNQMPDTAIFCNRCGTRLAEAIPQNIVPQNEVPQIEVPQMAPVNQVPPMEPAMNQVPPMNPNVPPMGMAPQMNPNMPPMGMPGMAPMPQIVPAGKNIRYRCHMCKSVSDVKDDSFCPNCKTPALPGGYIKLYRMGSFYGVASPFGIYLDNEPCGYIGNKQTCWIRVPFGVHQLHIAIGLSRKCNDLVVTIAPDQMLQAAKTYMKPGAFTNSFNIMAAAPQDVPD